MNQIFVYSILAIFILSNLVLGYLVIRSNSTRSVNRLFFLFILSIVFWLIANALADASNNEARVILWTKITMVAASAIPLILLLFSLVFPGNNRIKLINSTLITIPFLIIGGLSLLTNSIIKSAVSINDVTQVEFGSLASFYALYFITYSLTALGIFFNKFLKAKGIEKSQLEYLLAGLFLSIVIGSLTNLILPVVFHFFAFTPFGALTTIFMLVFTAYSIISNQLFDIRVIIRRTVVYSGLLLFTLATYSMVIFFFTALFGGEEAFNPKTFVANLIAATLIAVGFDPLRHWLTITTDKFLFKGEYDPQAVLAELSQKLSSSIDLKEATQSLVMIIKAQMRLTHTAVIIFGFENAKPYIKDITQDGYPNPSILQLAQDSPLLAQIVAAPQVITIEGLHAKCNSALAKDKRFSDDPIGQACERLLLEMESLHIAIAVPIMVSQKAIGVFFVGEKLSGDVLTKDEIEFLQIVANQTANTIEKTRFWEEDKLKSEFVSIASHELLTPTAAMKGYLSMILDENMGQVDDTARRYLTKVSQSTERLSKLVEDLLNVSRIESGRLKINKREFSLVELVTKATDEIQVNAKAKSLDLAFVAPHVAPPHVCADPDHIYRVLINLIGNSVKYTQQGWVRTFVSQYDATHLLFTVADSGLGIPKESIPHLFEKFYRADRREIAGIQGTGLGLYISKKIIELMGGQLWVESEVNKGSSFYFTLPIVRQLSPTTSQSSQPQVAPSSSQNQLSIPVSSPQ